MFCDTGKLHQIQISVSINDVLLKHSHTHHFGTISYMYGYIHAELLG